MNDDCHFDFEDSVSQSRELSARPYWQQVYEKGFGRGVVIVNHFEDGEHQRAGIDRSVVLPNSKQFLIDEKVRPGMHDDILLEEYSDFERKIPGWLTKPLRADYIAYVIEPGRFCWLLPIPPLQRAWAQLGERWKENGTVKPIPVRASFISRKRPDGTTQTVIWKSKCWAIMPSVLYKSIFETSRIDFDWKGEEHADDQLGLELF